MTWAQKRKFVYLGSIILIFFLVVVVPFLLSLYKAPSCFDGKQNQTEQGVDCGGPCVLLCPTQYVSPNILWSRFSKVSDGVYNVLAYIENPNLNAGANNVSYTFKLYDSKGILLKERLGQTFIPANKIVAVFEPEMLTGNQIPQRVEFSFTSRAIWLKQESQEANLSVSGGEITRLDSSPRLTTTVSNKTTNEVKSIEAVAIIYNEAGNTIAFSRTIVDSLGDKQSAIINFNWPRPFTDTYARTEIILRVLK